MSDEMSVGVPGDSRCGSQCLAGTVEAGPHSPNPAWGRLGLAGGSCRAHSENLNLHTGYPGGNSATTKTAHHKPCLKLVSFFFFLIKNKLSVTSSFLNPKTNKGTRKEEFKGSATLDKRTRLRLRPPFQSGQRQ